MALGGGEEARRDRVRARARVRVRVKGSRVRVRSAGAGLHDKSRVAQSEGAAPRAGYGAQVPGRSGRVHGGGRGCTWLLCSQSAGSICSCESSREGRGARVKPALSIALPDRASWRSFAIVSSFRRTTANRSTQNIVATARHLPGAGSGVEQKRRIWGPWAASAPGEGHPDDLGGVRLALHGSVAHAGASEGRQARPAAPSGTGSGGAGRKRPERDPLVCFSDLCYSSEAPPGLPRE